MEKFEHNGSKPDPTNPGIRITLVMSAALTVNNWYLCRDDSLCNTTVMRRYNIGIAFRHCRSAFYRPIFLTWHPFARLIFSRRKNKRTL